MISPSTDETADKDKIISQFPRQLRRESFGITELPDTSISEAWSVFPGFYFDKDDEVVKLSKKTDTGMFCWFVHYRNVEWSGIRGLKRQ